MPSSARLREALDTLFAELSEAVGWERDLAAEARAAATRRERLARSIRATAETLEPLDREPHLARLRDLLGAADPSRKKRRPTPRTRAVLRWLARHEDGIFTTAALREHLQSRGLPTGSHYVPLLIQRYEADGIVTALARGRYRINRDHPDLIAN